MTMDREQYRPAVLVVDDEFLLREYAADAIGSVGFEVFQASNASEALDLLEERPDICVLFTDIQMPGSLDGLDLAQEARRRWPDLRVVVTSARVRPKPHQWKGHFLPKPYLAETVARLLQALVAKPAPTRFPAAETS